MNHHRCLRNDFSRHFPSNLDSAGTDSAEAMNVCLSLYDDMLRSDPARTLARVVNRCSVFAMNIAPQPAFYQGGPANNAAAGEVPLAS